MFKAKKKVTMPTSTHKRVDNDLQEYKECKEALPANINIAHHCNFFLKIVLEMKIIVKIRLGSDNYNR